MLGRGLEGEGVGERETGREGCRRRRVGGGGGRAAGGLASREPSYARVNPPVTSSEAAHLGWRRAAPDRPSPATVHAPRPAPPSCLQPAVQLPPHRPLLLHHVRIVSQVHHARRPSPARALPCLPGRSLRRLTFAQHRLLLGRPFLTGPGRRHQAGAADGPEEPRRRRRRPRRRLLRASVPLARRLSPTGRARSAQSTDRACRARRADQLYLCLTLSRVCWCGIQGGNIPGCRQLPARVRSSSLLRRVPPARAARS